jgi:hypothetical protein
MMTQLMSNWNETLKLAVAAAVVVGVIIATTRIKDH